MLYIETQQNDHKQGETQEVTNTIGVMKPSKFQVSKFKKGKKSQLNVVPEKLQHNPPDYKTLVILAED